MNTRSGQFDVYNLEVEGPHNYYVGDQKVLVHNKAAITRGGAFDLPGQGKGWVKMRGNQGWKDADGNFWKKDMLHKDHWDISDAKGNKIREVDFGGNEIWPKGPKNRNKG